MHIGYQEYTFFPLQTRTATHFTNAVQFSHLDFKRLRNMAKVLPSFQNGYKNSHCVTQKTKRKTTIKNDGGFLPILGVSAFSWSGRADLNRRPPRPKRGALTELRYAPNRERV